MSRHHPLPELQADPLRTRRTPWRSALERLGRVGLVVSGACAVLYWTGYAAPVAFGLRTHLATINPWYEPDQIG